MDETNYDDFVSLLKYFFGTKIGLIWIGARTYETNF